MLFPLPLGHQELPPEELDEEELELSLSLSLSEPEESDESDGAFLSSSGLVGPTGVSTSSGSSSTLIFSSVLPWRSGSLTVTFSIVDPLSLMMVMVPEGLSSRSRSIDEFSR